MMQRGKKSSSGKEALNTRDYGLFALLSFLAAFIWLRNLSWMTTMEDTLPLLVALPLFVWLGSPWNLKSSTSPLSSIQSVASIVCFTAGVAIDSTFLLALGWTLLLYAWLSTKFEGNRQLAKLSVLPLMAFPWVSLDADRIGWWFRLSGAWITAHFYTFMGYDVLYSGTSVEINGLPISVEAACAGLNTLQSMLIAGSVVAFIFLKDTSRFWWNLPFLIVMAWIANTIRIIAIAGAALLVNPEFALGNFHTWGAWVILMLMFALCWLFFSLQEPKSSAVNP